MHPTLHAVKPGSKAGIAKIDPSSTPGFKGDRDQVRDRAEKELADNTAAIAALQERLYAENTRALLVVLQGMDTSGKDGVIRHVFSGVNPQGCHVTSFKKPSENELDQDYLWRIHQQIPPRGEIGVFNRAHYEDVLIVRVHDLVPKGVWSARYAQINEFEHYLAANGVVILKFFLHISKQEQLERLRARLEDPAKNWKFQAGDVRERQFWKDYQAAYEDAITKCSTEWAPWYVIPADRKWYRNWAVSTIVRQTLEMMNPKYPPAPRDLHKVKLV